jgi:hypothetical protein
VCKLISAVAIDISWVDWAYKSSTCDVMYWRQRRHLYYGGENLKILFDLLHRSSSFLGGQRWQPIQIVHSLHIRGKGLGGGLDTILMSMISTGSWWLPLTLNDKKKAPISSSSCWPRGLSSLVFGHPQHATGQLYRYFYSQNLLKFEFDLSALFIIRLKHLFWTLR